jgi:small-conductance mechanosensitive channel
MRLGASGRWLVLAVGLTLSLASAREEGAIDASANVLPMTVEGIAGRQAGIEQRIKDTKIRAADTLSAVASGATYEELRERSGLYRRWQGALDSQLRSLRKLNSALDFNAEKEAEARSWTGFTEEPPYSFSLVEQVMDDVSAQRLEVQSLQLTSGMHEESLTRGASQLAERRKELRLAMERVERSEASLRGTWLVQLAELRVKSAEASVESASLAQQVTAEALKGRRDYLRFLERKLGLAQAQMRFRQEELDAAIDRIAKKAEAVQQELNAAIAEDAALRRTLASARAELGKVEAAPLSDSAAGAGLAEKRAALDVAAFQVETNDLRIELLRNTVLMTHSIKSVWEDRFWAAGMRNLVELKEREAEYRGRLDRQAQWRNLIERRMNALMKESFRGTLHADAAGSPVERERKDRIRADMETRLALYHRALNALAYAEEVTQRLCVELLERQTNISVTVKFRSAVAWAGAFLMGIWNTELYVAEGSVVVDGRRIPVSRSVTVGKVAVALLIFSIGLWLARRTYATTKRKSARWFREDAKIQIVSVALAILVAVFSLCVAMATVRIPWSVFAFAGGALAIGIGFGAQTVVKNFITGIMLIFGGTIRVGDTIEMDGQCGQVVSIGFSKSILRRHDGVELLVPNSCFMEQSLTHWTHTDKLVRQVVSVGVAYGSSSQRVSDLLALAAQEHPQVLKDPNPVVLFDDFGDHALLFTLRFWVTLDQGVDASIVRSDIRHRINALLTQEGIGIPFPQRDVHMKLTRPIEVSLVNAPRIPTEPAQGTDPL